MPAQPLNPLSKHSLFPIGKADDAVDTAAGTSNNTAAAVEEEEERPNVALATMDIFAGCGGLSEGMHQVCGDDGIVCVPMTMPWRPSWQYHISAVGKCFQEGYFCALPFLAACLEHFWVEISSRFPVHVHI